MFPAGWREAWIWSRIRAHIEQIEARDELLALNGRREKLVLGLAKMYKDVVSKARGSPPSVMAVPKCCRRSVLARQPSVA